MTTTNPTDIGAWLADTAAAARPAAPTGDGPQLTGTVRVFHPTAGPVETTFTGTWEQAKAAWTAAISASPETGVSAVCVKVGSRILSASLGDSAWKIAGGRGR